MALNLALLAGLIDLAHWPTPLATAVVAIIGTLLRFLANDRLVFGHRRPTWSRLSTYGLAVSGSTCLGYGMVNALVWLGVHYLTAAIFTTLCSVTLNLIFNFRWVWRPKNTAATPSLRTEHSDFPVGAISTDLQVGRPPRWISEGRTGREKKSRGAPTSHKSFVVHNPLNPR